MTRARSGFTLIEVLVSLTIASLVLLLVDQLFAAVTECTRRLETARARQDTERLATRWLEAALLSLEAGGPAGPFEGHPNQMRFTTWLSQPGGWMERRAVELSVRDSSLVATGSEPVALQGDVRNVEFDYLLEPGAESQWAREWVSPVSAPLAVRLRLTRSDRVDTLVLLIKGRG
jgi:prepilin-type N-terminal cleavage/methylation domain-containing protein